MAALAAPPMEQSDVTGVSPSISVGDRQFTYIGGVWTDWNLLGSAKAPSDTISVKPFSEAYFRLNRVSGMAKLLAVGERVIFVWHSCVVKIDPVGAEKWNPAWEHLL